MLKKIMMLLLFANVAVCGQVAAAKSVGVSEKTKNAHPVGQLDIVKALPADQLMSDLFVGIFAAEVAADYGQWQEAYGAFMSAAKKSGDPRIASRAVEAAVGANMLDAALSASKLWYQLEPQSDEALQWLTNFLVQAGDLDSIKIIFEKKLQNTAPIARVRYISFVQTALVTAKNKALAFIVLEQILTPYVDMPEASSALARSALLMGDRVLALKYVNMVIKMQPDSEQAILLLAQASTDKDRVVADLTKFLLNNPNAREVDMALARALVDQEKFAEARVRLLLIHQKYPGDANAVYMLGILAAREDDAINAEKYLTQYVSLQEATNNQKQIAVPALLLLSRISQDKQDIDAALAWLEKIDSSQSRNPAYFVAMLKRAVLLGKRGDVTLAQNILKQYQAANDEESIKLIQARAQILYDAKLTQDALLTLAAGLVKFSDSVDLMYDYALLAEKLNDLKTMEDVLRQVMVKAPYRPDAYNALGFAFAQRNIRLTEARLLIEKALSLSPNDPSVIDSMGWVEFRLNNMRAAEGWLRKAYSLRSDDEIALHLGELLWTLGNKKEAQALWRTVKNKDPKNEALLEILKRFNVNFND